MILWDGEPPKDDGDGVLAFTILTLAMVAVVVIGQMLK